MADSAEFREWQRICGDKKINRRLAANHGERVQRLRAAQLDVRQFRLGGVQLSRCLRDIQIGNDATSPAVLRQLQRTLIRFNRAGNHRVFIVQGAQREIIVRDLGADVQFRGFQIVRAGDKTLVCGFGLPPHTSPQINFPAEINRRGEGVVIIRLAGRFAILRFVDAGALAVEVACGRASGGELRIISRTRGGGQVAGLFKPRGGSGEILVVRER